VSLFAPIPVRPWSFHPHFINSALTIIFWKNMVLIDYIGIFLHVAILLAEYRNLKPCRTNNTYILIWLH
jgi:hypothetical protein